MEYITKIVIKNYWKISSKPPEKYKIDINVMPDSEIKKVNKKYLNRDRPTDVIAFSLQEGEEIPEEIPLIGQIVISKHAAQRQAPQYNHSTQEEMELLLIHGLLHVAGWEEGEKIQKCQEEIKRKIKRKA
ncbi:MAG: rRNA maturation RNase YbeY [Elusimicrobiota bacterium]